MGKGTECGVLLHDYTDFKPGDVLQCITGARLGEEGGWVGAPGESVGGGAGSRDRTGLR
mgnify:CR=1 FL=1